MFGFLSGNKREKVSDEVLAPPYDPVFHYLYWRVVNGHVPLYQAEVPVALMRPFAPTFEPHNTEFGRKVFNGMVRTYREGTLRLPLWLYPALDAFVVSDDYLIFYALKELGVQSFQCEVMGEPSIAGVSGIKGPAPIEFVRALPNGPDYDPKKQKYQVIKEMPRD